MKKDKMLQYKLYFIKMNQWIFYIHSIYKIILTRIDTIRDIDEINESIDYSNLECVSVNNSKTGSIKSNNYPQPYEPNTDCLYIIQPPTGIYKIEFLDLQMADSGDYVEVLISDIFILRITEKT